jgi:type IV pilus modification protein PilV
VKTIHPMRRNGFTLIEALVALLIMSFGLLTLAALQITLSRNADLARQRGEATRLAQERMECLRSYTQIGTAPGAPCGQTAAPIATAWNDLANGNDTVATNNTNYARSWTVASANGAPPAAAADLMHFVSVTVAWKDRANEAQTVELHSEISRSDPADSFSFGFPRPNNLNRVQNRNLSIPVPALNLGNGSSAYQVAANLAIIFNNDTGFIVKKCGFTVTLSSNLSSCVTYNALLLSGYISLTSAPDGTPSAFPPALSALLGIDITQMNGWDNANGKTIVCNVNAARDQNTGATIAGYDYYICLIPVAVGATWSGSTHLSGMSAGTDYTVCRFEYAASPGADVNDRNVQPYANVNHTLGNQNYVITTLPTCPTVQGLATTLHQSCVAANPRRKTDCPP